MVVAHKVGTQRPTSLPGTKAFLPGAHLEGVSNWGAASMLSAMPRARDCVRLRLAICRPSPSSAARISPSPAPTAGHKESGQEWRSGMPVRND